MSFHTDESLPADKPTAGHGVAGCYPVPIRLMYGTAAEINFWDVVYYRAYTEAGIFETSTQELVEQTGLSRQEIGRLRQAAVEHGELIEDISFSSGRRFALKVAMPNQTNNGFFWKPLGYVAQHWQRVVTPAIPKRVLNLFLQQPRQAVYCLSTRYIAAKCQRRFPYSNYQPAVSLNPADVAKALRLLVQLGLFLPEANGFRIEWAAFNQPASPMNASFEEPDPHAHPQFIAAAQIDQARAERAVDLLLIGHYDLESDFPEIFRDLSFLRGAEDFALLKNKVYKRRDRPPAPDRWAETWRVFQREQMRRTASIHSRKTRLRLETSNEATTALSLAITRPIDQVTAMVLIVRAEWPWHLPAAATLQVQVQLTEQTITRLTLESDRPEVRCPLRPNHWPLAGQVIFLTVQAAQPQPALKIEAWLEAKLRK